MKKKILLLLTLLLSAMLTAGCSLKSGLVITDNAPLATMQPREIGFAVPIGDATLEYDRELQMYYPAADGKTVTPHTETVTHSPSRPFAETIVRKWLESTMPANSDADTGKGVKLTLYGSTPVELSRDTAAVHLSVTAKKLDKSYQYLICQAITNLICKNTGIENVAFFIGEQSFALDLAEEQPGGVFTYSDPDDYAVQYEQLLASAASFADGSEKSRTDRVLLYFPIPETGGVLAQSRMVQFDSPAVGDIIQTLLKELAAGPDTEQIPAPALAGHLDFLTAIPGILQSQEGHGKVIDLRFADNWLDMLKAYQVSEDEVYASLCMTLCTYMPGVIGISVSIGGAPVDTALLIEQNEDELPEGKLILRKDISATLLDECTVFLPQQDTCQLVEVKRLVPFMQAGNPRSLLSCLCKSDLPGDSRTDTLPVLPQMTDSDIIGLGLEGETLVVNLAQAFPMDSLPNAKITQQLKAYAMVDTLCQSGPYRSVCFLQGGMWPEASDSSVSWSGEFYPWTGSQSE